MARSERSSKRLRRLSTDSDDDATEADEYKRDLVINTLASHSQTVQPTRRGVAVPINHATASEGKRSLPGRSAARVSHGSTKRTAIANESNTSEDEEDDSFDESGSSSSRGSSKSDFDGARDKEVKPKVQAHMNIAKAKVAVGAGRRRSIQTAAATTRNPKIRLRPPRVEPEETASANKTVRDKESAMTKTNVIAGTVEDNEDEQLSELNSVDGDADTVDADDDSRNVTGLSRGEDTTALKNGARAATGEEDEEDEEDAEGEEEEDDEVEDEEEEKDDDEDVDDEDDSEGSGLSEIYDSRGDTPDMSKLTRRQRSAYEHLNGDLMALSNEAQKKKHLTAEEHAMRRAEMARRRKNLSEKRNEEEKMDTINKLLKKQAPRRRGKLLEGTGTLPVHGKDVANTEAGTISPIKPSSLYARWQSSVHGSIVAVPDEWLAAPVGYPLSAIF